MILFEVHFQQGGFTELLLNGWYQLASWIVSNRKDVSRVIVIRDPA